MNSRERVISTLRHQEVDRFPRDLWALPNVSIFHADLLSDLRFRFPSDIAAPQLKYGTSHYANGIPYRKGRYTDEFGSQFCVAEDGVVGEVKNPVFKDWSELNDYRLPWELLEQMDLSHVNEAYKKTDCFVLAGTYIRPFERMQFLRGTEDLFVDLALGEPNVERLAKMLHEFSLKELEKIVQTDIDGISFMDDWGSQRSLLISPVIWHQLFKPMYQEYCELAHSKGKYVFLHSDGNIEAIYPDFVEIGVDAINSQLFVMDMEELVRQYGDKITFWGEIDRQNILPFGTEADVRKAVDKVAATVMGKNGKRTGAIAQCEWNAMDPYQNILAVFDEWNRQ